MPLAGVLMIPFQVVGVLHQIVASQAEAEQVVEEPEVFKIQKIALIICISLSVFYIC